MGIRPKRLDSCGDCHPVEAIRRASHATSAAWTERAAPSSLRPSVTNRWLSRPVFPMLRWLHLYVSLPSSQSLPLGLVWHGRSQHNYGSLSPEAMPMFLWGGISPSRSYTRIQYPVHCMYAKGEYDVLRTCCLSYFLLDHELPLFCLASYEIPACRSLHIHR